MSAVRLVLASRSETRLRVLRQAGFDPVVAPADVDESSTVTDAELLVRELAHRKAAAIAPQFPDDVVLACDSVVEIDGAPVSKPATPEEAATWWRSMRGSTVTVWTGHAVRVGDRSEVRSSSADVHLAAVTDAEVDAYVRTGEPMTAAGAFRLDGRAGLFVESITGDPGTVHGVSLPLLRELLEELGVEVTALWA